MARKIFAARPRTAPWRKCCRGLEATSRTSCSSTSVSHPELVLVVLTVFDDDRRIFEAICAGASGYLLKKTPTPRLIQGIRDAAAGGAPFSPEIAARVIALFRQTAPAVAEDHDLTPHEVRVLKMLVDGHNYKTAA